MGDKRRFTVTADLLAAYLPRGAKVLDVAGGRGYLSLALEERGLRSTVIDPRVTGLAGKHRRAQRRGHLAKFHRLVRNFSERELAGYDFAIGLHPDEATEPLARAAGVIPVAIIPCCNMWKGIESHACSEVSEMIRRTWQRMDIRWQEIRLPITGKNLLLMTR